MSKEHPSNIAFLCSHHGAQMPQTDEGPDGQKYVKVRFPIPGCGQSSENMWVKVDSFDATEGILDNDPFYVNYQLGDVIRFEMQPDGRRMVISS